MKNRTPISDYYQYKAKTKSSENRQFDSPKGPEKKRHEESPVSRRGSNL